MLILHLYCWPLFQYIFRIWINKNKECCCFQLLIRGLPIHPQNYAQLPFNYFIKYVTNEPQILGFHVWTGNWVLCLSVSRTEWTSGGKPPSCEAEWTKTKILASKAGGGHSALLSSGCFVAEGEHKGNREKNRTTLSTKSTKPTSERGCWPS